MVEDDNRAQKTFYERQKELVDYISHLIQELYRMNRDENRDFHGRMELNLKANGPDKCNWKLDIFPYRK